MTPYYRHDRIVLFHGDCREALPHLKALYAHTMKEWLPPVDCVLTDPPYGIMKGAAFVRNGGQTVTDDSEEGWNVLVPEREWIPQALRLLRFGGYFAAFADTRRIRETENAICDWDTDDDHGKYMSLWRRFYLINPAPPPTPRPTFMSGVQECVIAWKSASGVYKREWYGGGATPNFWIGIPATRGEHSEHPAEKPLEAMTLLMNALCRPGGLVLDPFAGSGTTLRAAQLTGRRAIGIELEERYCELIARRLSQAVRSIPEQPVLFS